MSAYKARPVLHIRDKSGSGKTPYALTFTDVVGKYGKDLKKRQGSCIKTVVFHAIKLKLSLKEFCIFPILFLDLFLKLLLKNTIR